MGNSIPHTTTVGGSGCHQASKLWQRVCPIKTNDMDEKSWQVMHMNVMKGFTAAQSNEHQRNWTERGWDFAIGKGKYDRARERLNFEVVKGGKIQAIDKKMSIPERMAETLLQRGVKDPNEGLAEPKYRTVVDFILSGSQNAIRHLAFGDQEVVYEPGDNPENATLKRMPGIEQWAKDMYRFMSDKFGEENIVGCYVHLDETSPHMHLTLLPIRDGKFAFKKMFAGKDKLEFSERTKRLHDELAEVNRKWNLKRGRNVSETRRETPCHRGIPPASFGRMYRHRRADCPT